MRIIFKTNIDCPSGMWKFPSDVTDRILVGDYVRPINFPQYEFKVVKRTHYWDNKSFLEIELTRQSIHQ